MRIPRDQMVLLVPEVHWYDVPFILKVFRGYIRREDWETAKDVFSLFADMPVINTWTDEKILNDAGQILEAMKFAEQFQVPSKYPSPTGETVFHSLRVYLHIPQYLNGYIKEVPLDPTDKQSKQQIRFFLKQAFPKLQFSVGRNEAGKFGMDYKVLLKPGFRLTAQEVAPHLNHLIGFRTSEVENLFMSRCWEEPYLFEKRWYTPNIHAIYFGYKDPRHGLFDAAFTIRR